MTTIKKFPDKTLSSKTSDSEVPNARLCSAAKKNNNNVHISIAQCTHIAY